MAEDSTRRDFIRGATVGTAGLISLQGLREVAADEQTAQIPAATAGATNAAPLQKPLHHHSTESSGEFPRQHAGRGGPIGSPTDRGKLVSGFRAANDPPVSVDLPDLPKLAWEMKDGVKEFHLVAEHVRREVLPDLWFDFWGYNGTMPGPLIEAVQGDRVRIIVHNHLPEATTVHWHGLELPVAMDGVPGLTQEPIPPGGMFTYEFDLHQDGTFFYHSHGAMQEIMGMTGMFVIHPRESYAPTIDHDFGLIVQEYAVLPQSNIPNSVSEGFNFFTINGRSGPYVTPLVVRLGSRVRIRFMNLSAMDHHPMHLHGHTFWVTGTEGGRIPESAWIPTNNVIVGVGQTRDVEFIANNPGDWMLHCHILHHMMNHMVSMVGPMPGGSSGEKMSRLGIPHSDVTPEMRGGEFASGQLGAGLERSMGPSASGERPIMTGMRPSEKDAKFNVPGYPQDMMEMHGMMPPEQMKKIMTPLTRGMRRNWPMSTQAMMTVLRVLPDELYDQVVSGKEDIEPGSSTPGAGPGEKMMSPGEHGMHSGHGAPSGKDAHSGHAMPAGKPMPHHPNAPKPPADSPPHP